MKNPIEMRNTAFTCITKIVSNNLYGTFDKSFDMLWVSLSDITFYKTKLTCQVSNESLLVYLIKNQWTNGHL